MPYKLTTGFLIISVAIFAVAAIVITRSAERNEKSNLIDIVSQQSSKDAQVIAGILTDVVSSPDGEIGSGAPSDPLAGYSNLATTTFLANSNIVGLSLIDTEGNLIWTSESGVPHRVDESNQAYMSAVAGDAATRLDEGVNAGDSAYGDLVSTYIPLLDVNTRQPAQIIEVKRDVTADLQARIDSTRNTNFRTVFSTLGGSFVILFGIVLAADVLLARSRKRSILQERSLAEEKLVAGQLEIENKQLRDLNDERDRFLSMVSHELRTPLTAMVGFTDVVRNRLEGESLEKNVKHLDAMRRNGHHLNMLIEDMLEVTRIQSGKFEIEKDGFVLENLLKQVETSGRVLLRPRGQKLNIERSAKDLEVHGDSRRIMQVLLNLLSNASKYSPADGKITVSVEQIDNSVRISVTDEGAGIPQEECNRLFERFYRRDDEATRSQSGLGLGLSIVKAIVDGHQGSIEVNSTVGVGTTMAVTLPGARKVAPQVSTTPELAPTQWQQRRDLRSVPQGAKLAS